MVTLRLASHRAGKLRTGRFFVGVQVAFSFCLAMTAAAFLFSLRNLTSVDTGFDRRNVAVLDIATEWRNKSPEVERVLMDQLQRRVAVLPGVDSAAIAS